MLCWAKEVNDERFPFVASSMGMPGAYGEDVLLCMLAIVCSLIQRMQRMLAVNQEEGDVRHYIIIIPHRED